MGVTEKVYMLHVNQASQQQTGRESTLRSISREIFRDFQQIKGISSTVGKLMAALKRNEMKCTKKAVSKWKNIVSAIFHGITRTGASRKAKHIPTGV